MKIKLYNEDCLKRLRLIKDKSVNLVLIDPPYNINIKGEKWDNFKTVSAYVEFMGKVFIELERVLKDNGSFYFFHNDFLQVVELQNFINKNTKFKFKNLIIWDKEIWRSLCWKNPGKDSKLRSWFNNTEYCLYYTFQDETGLKNINKPMMKKINDYMNNELFKLKLKPNDINKLFWENNYCKNNSDIATHWFGKNNQNNLPTKEKYLILQKLTNGFKKPYEELRQEYEELRQEYEKDRYTHNLDPYHSVIWRSKNKNKGKLHPCEKPQDILERIIKTSSNEGDTVLDCFMGSGSTGVACKNLNRNFIGIELDKKYFKIAKKRIE